MTAKNSQFSMNNVGELMSSVVKLVDDWVLDFYAMCKKCIRKFPAETICENPPLCAARRIAVIDANKCRPYITANLGWGVFRSVTLQHRRLLES